MTAFVELTSRFAGGPKLAVDADSIAAVAPYSYDSTLTEITLKAGARAVLVKESVDEVVAAVLVATTPPPRRRQP